jgi:hypothetical protein
MDCSDHEPENTGRGLVRFVGGVPSPRGLMLFRPVSPGEGTRPTKSCTSMVVGSGM